MDIWVCQGFGGSYQENQVVSANCVLLLIKADDLKPVSPPIKHPHLVCSWSSIDSSRIQLFSNHQRLFLQLFLSIHLTDLANRKWNKSVVYSLLLFFIVLPSWNRAQNLTVLKMSFSWSSIDYCVNHDIQNLGMEVNSIKHRKSPGLCFSQLRYQLLLLRHFGVKLTKPNKQIDK